MSLIKDIQRINEIGDFLHLAFCVDGETRFDGMTELEKDGVKIEGVLFKIEDKRRGEFFVAMYKNEL